MNRGQIDRDFSLGAERFRVKYNSGCGHNGSDVRCRVRKCEDCGYLFRSCNREGLQKCSYCKYSFLSYEDPMDIE